MILREISDTSIVISLFRYFARCYGSLEQRISYISHNSRTQKLTKGLWEKVKICFKYSFWGRITEVEKKTPIVLDCSWTVNYSINFYKKWKDKIIHYLRTSITLDIAKDTKEQLNFSPVRTISIIIGIALTVNVFLSIVFRVQIDSSGWLMRGLFLLVVLPGLFCPADWSRVKRSSIFIRKFWRD